MNYEIVKIIIKILGFIVVAVGVILIFDARNISKKWFSFGDRNEGVKTLKIVGFVLSVIGAVITMIV